MNGPWAILKPFDPKETESHWICLQSEQKSEAGGGDPIEGNVLQEHAEAPRVILKMRQFISRFQDPREGM